MSARAPSPGFGRLPAATVVALAAAYGAATLLAQFIARAPAWRFDSPLQFNSSLAVLFGLGWAAFCGVVQGRGDAAERRRWLIAAAAMLLLVAVQATDTAFAGAFGLDDDWLADLPLWIVATALLRAALRRPAATPWAMRAWRTGVVVLLAFLVCDLGQSHAAVALAGPAALADTVAEGLELLTIECYVVAIVFAGSRPAATRAAPPRTLDGDARRLFAATRPFGAARLRLASLAAWPGLLASCLWLAATAAPRVRRAGGPPVASQLADLLALAFGSGFDPADHDGCALHRPGGRAVAASFLRRGAATAGLVEALNGMRRLPLGGRELSDRLLFDACCRRNGLPTPPLLLACDGDGIDLHVARGALERDLWCRPRTGATDGLLLRRIGHGRLRASNGDEGTVADWLARWQRRGRASPLLVQALSADAATDTVRILTCIDAMGRPVATHGLLRGTLPVVNPGPPSWPAAFALALAAHRAFPDCIVVEWDIASTPDGPLLLGGCARPDLLRYQRACRQGIGCSALGPLLQQHLDALLRAHALDND